MLLEIQLIKASALLEVCHVLYTVITVQQVPDLHLGGALARAKGTDALTHTFALICVFVKNCLCRYNFSIPEREKEKKSYRSPIRHVKHCNEHRCTQLSRDKPREKL